MHILQGSLIFPSAGGQCCLRDLSFNVINVASGAVAITLSKLSMFVLSFSTFNLSSYATVT